MDSIANVTIVGGGLSGILLALRLSSDPLVQTSQKIVLIEEKSTLGGRLFFSRQENASSGFGFEILDDVALDAFYRHICAHLTEDEKNKLEELDPPVEPGDDSSLNLSSRGEAVSSRGEAVSSRGEALSSPGSTGGSSLTPPRIFFVKKELTTVENLLSDSSEILTKKEALTLRTLLSEQETLEAKTKIWNELPKATKDAFVPIVQTFLGSEIKGVPLERVFKVLSHFLNNPRKPLLKMFHQDQKLEQMLEKFLLERGVEVRKQCKLLRIFQTENKNFSLLLSDEKNPQQKNLETEHLVLALPLAQCAGLAPKDFYAPEQSRFISRVRPLSMVVVEMPYFSKIKSESLTQEFHTKDVFVFPVERACGFLTSDGRILFSTLLEYEDSLQAPAVREAVARLRRAASRILKPSVVEEQRRGPGMPQEKVAEKIILLPVAHSLPYDLNTQHDLKQTKMGAAKLYCCGDSFYSLGDESWKMIINSVHEVARTCLP